MRVQMTIGEIRQIVRETLELAEAVELDTQKQSFIKSLMAMDRVAGTKANILLLRMLSRRIGEEESETMADEVRKMISSLSDKAKAAQLKTDFNSAYEDIRDELPSSKRIGDMISATLHGSKQPHSLQTLQM